MAFEGDRKLEFRALQKRRFAHLSRDEWLDLFHLWKDHYEARECVKQDATQARLTELVEERRNLFLQRHFMLPSAAAAANDRLRAIGQELAALCAPKRPEPPLGTWIAE